MKTKLTKKDKSKILNRYITKRDEYLKLSSEELKAIYQKGGLSSTDRQALVDATSKVLEKERDAILKESEVAPVKFNVDEGEE